MDVERKTRDIRDGYDTITSPMADPTVHNDLMGTYFIPKATVIVATENTVRAAVHEAVKGRL